MMAPMCALLPQACGTSLEARGFLCWTLDHCFEARAFLPSLHGGSLLAIWEGTE